MAVEAAEASAGPSLAEAIEHELCVLHPRPGDLLVCYLPVGMPPAQRVLVQKTLDLALTGTNVRALTCDDNIKLQHLSREQLKELGLQRIR